MAGKKFSLVVFIFFMCLSFSYTQTFGDVNSNGSVDIVDALLVAQKYVGLSVSNFNASVADVNCSGSIDIVDALLIAQYYVGLLSGFPCAPTATPTSPPTAAPTVAPTAVPTAAPGEGDIKITLSTTTIYTGNNFTTRVSANTGSKYLGSFDVIVYFSSYAMQVNTSIGNSGITAGSNITLSSMYSSSSTMEVIATSSAQIGTDITLFTINWIALTESVSTIDAIPYMLRDTNGATIGSLLTTNIQVSIIQTITPEPTIEPTIAPTPEPTPDVTPDPTAEPTPTPTPDPAEVQLKAMYQCGEPNTATSILRRIFQS